MPAGDKLVALLVVCAMIGIVLVVAVGNYRTSIVRAKEAALRRDLSTMRTLIDQYGMYPIELPITETPHATR